MKKAWLGILIIVLIFGFTVIGCGNNNGKDPEKCSVDHSTIYADEICGCGDAGTKTAHATITLVALL